MASVRKTTEIHKRAVSLRFLFRFREFLRQQVGEEQYQLMLTRDVVHGMDQAEQIRDGKVVHSTVAASYSIRGLTETLAMNMVDFLKSDAEEAKVLTGRLLGLHVKELEGVDPVEHEEKTWFGETECFCSHPWDVHFDKLLMALEDPRTTNTKILGEHIDTKFWVDIFAVNQHHLEDKELHAVVELERKEDLDSFENVITYSRQGAVLFLYPFTDPLLLQRAWCWLEISLALKHSKPIVLALAPGCKDLLTQVTQSFRRSNNEIQGIEQKIVHMLEDVDVRASKCKLDSDLERILKQIERDVGAEAANEKVKLAIAGIMMATADSLLETCSANAWGLYEAMLEHFKHAQREKALSLNKLVRAYLIMGQIDKACERCQQAIKIQRQILAETDDADIRNEVELELAENLNSLGRIYGDMISDKKLPLALTNLYEALHIRIAQNSPMVHEVQYNIGRAIALCCESHPDKMDIQLLDTAKLVLEEAYMAQNAKTPPPPSLGANCVLLGKVMDLMDPDDDSTLEAATAYFDQGIDIQKNGYGENDPRVSMTKMSKGYHFLSRKKYIEAWKTYQEAHEGLFKAVQENDLDPLRLLWCQEALFDTLDHLPDLAAKETKNLAERTTGCINWISNNKAYLLEAPKTRQVLEKVTETAKTKLSKF